MKNLVIFHMESLSNFIFQMSQDSFSNLHRKMEYLEKYSNYYSTATSTFMTIADLFYGTTKNFEKSEYLEDLFSVPCKEKSLFDILGEKEYRTECFYYGFKKEEIKSGEMLNDVINKNGEKWIGNNRQEFITELDNAILQNGRFAIFIEDDSSHITYQGSRYLAGINAKENFKNRYRRIDETIGDIFELLEKKSLLENTMVVLYGDHGEEYWYHGLYEGYTHAIEPFTSIIHCPLFIFDGYKEKIDKPELLSTVDLAPIILYRLGFGENIQRRKYSFARNLFANQSRRADIFHKAYSVTDGEYTLIVTEKGISLYFNVVDPFCATNLLEFYKFRRGILTYNKKYDCMVSSHYKCFMTESMQLEIKNRYEELIEQLQEYIKELPCLKFKFPYKRIERTSGKISTLNKYNKRVINVISTLKSFLK